MGLIGLFNSTLLSSGKEIAESHTLTKKLSTCTQQAEESFHNPSQSNNAQIEERILRASVNKTYSSPASGNSSADFGRQELNDTQKEP